MNTKTLRKVMYPIETVIYLTLFIIAMLNIFGDVNIYSYTQAKTVAINAGVGVIAVYAPLIVEAFLKRKLSPFIDIIVCVDLFASILLGEGCQVYLNFVGWDKLLHFFGTAELALLGSVLAKSFLSKNAPSAKKTVMMSVIFAFFFSVACEAMWEIYEFACDSLMGTNMQKYLPEEYYDLIGVDGTLGVTADDLAAFFSTSDGYTYALQDTMFDIITDVCGGAFGCAATAIVFHYKPEWQDNVLFIDRKDDDVSSQSEPEPGLASASDSGEEIASVAVSSSAEDSYALLNNEENNSGSEEENSGD